MDNNIKLVVTSSSFYQLFFRLKGDNLQNIFLQSPLKSLKINNIYLAQVSQIMDSLGAAFVNLGNNQQAFLKFNKSRDKLRVGEKILVQVVKEETIPNKLAVVSRDITLRGSLIIFKPFLTNIIFSKKLTENDRNQIITTLGYSKENSKYGLIIRSLYKHNLLQELALEFQHLKDLWGEIKNQNKVGLLWEANVIENVLLSNSQSIPQEIITSTISEAKQVKNILNHHKFLDIKESIYTKKEDILNYYNISESLQDITSNKLLVKDSLNLVFYEQEAFNYIDVNFAGELSFNTKEEVAYKTNMEIFPIIVQQILLRNLSGQIFIDILKITNKQYRNNLLALAKKLFTLDENKTTVLGFSNMGLLEISRQKTQDSFSLISKSLDYKLHCLIMNLKKLIVFSPEKVIVVISSKQLARLKEVASKDLEELNISIQFKIDETSKIPKIEE